MEYKKYSQEQLERAKNADIIAFLSAYMGLEFKRAGKYYQCKQHSSLVVYADRKGFVWNSQNISGGDTIDFLPINEQISNAFVRLHKPFRRKSIILMVDFCHIP